MRQVHRAGEKALVDFSGKRPTIVDGATGEVVPVELFRRRAGRRQLGLVDRPAAQAGLPTWVVRMRSVLVLIHRGRSGWRRLQLGDLTGRLIVDDVREPDVLPVEHNGPGCRPSGECRCSPVAPTHTHCRFAGVGHHDAAGLCRVNSSRQGGDPHVLPSHDDIQRVASEMAGQTYDCAIGCADTHERTATRVWNRRAWHPQVGSIEGDSLRSPGN